MLIIFPFLLSPAKRNIMKNELFSQYSFANQIKLSLNFHLPSGSWPELFPLLHAPSSSQSFLKASSRATFPPRNLIVLITELEGHYSGYLWRISLAPGVDKADSQPIQVNGWPQAQLSLNALPLTSLSNHPLCLAIQRGVPFPFSLLHSAAFLRILCLWFEDSEVTLLNSGGFGVPELIIVFPSLTIKTMNPRQYTSGLSHR